MREQQLLSRLVGALERSGVPYLLTGSFASSLQGYPRAVENLDLVARLEASGLRELKESFPPPEFELDEETALRAIGQGESFALLDLAGGGRVDIWPASDSPFDRSRFARRYSRGVPGPAPGDFLAGGHDPVEAVLGLPHGGAAKTGRGRPGGLRAAAQPPGPLLPRRAGRRSWGWPPS